MTTKPQQAGAEARAIVEAIVGALTKMKSDMEWEKLSLEKIRWKREKEIVKAIENAARLTGWLEKIAGEDFKPIESLELKTLAAEAGETPEEK